MWPFTKKTRHFEFNQSTINEELKQAKKDRLELQVEPDSQNWEVMMDLAQYFNSVVLVHTVGLMTKEAKEVVTAVNKLITDGEESMDFDKTAVGVGMLASIAFPILPDEDQEVYNTRIMQHYALYKSVQKNYD